MEFVLDASIVSKCIATIVSSICNSCCDVASGWCDCGTLLLLILLINRQRTGIGCRRAIC